ncbi:MAG: twin-arginine translocation signal domain-containing protein, partial [Burkholderiales bacterium]
MNARIPNLSRRQFIVGSATAGAGLALGIAMPLVPRLAAAQTPLASPEIGAWVVIQPDDAVIVRVVRSEMG